MCRSKTLMYKLVILGFLTLSGTAMAQTPLPPVQPPAPQGRENSFFFAYPGSTCPGGSERYKGPEQALAAQTGAVYCKFIHNIFAMKKSAVGTSCPAGLKVYEDPHSKPDEDVIWCKLDQAPVNVGQKPPLPPK